MRLWHYKIIPFLPDLQLIAQWRELNSIFKKQDKHILINYVYEYEKRHLFAYTQMVLTEMANRGFIVRNFGNLGEYFNCSAMSLTDFSIKNPFPKHHNNRYLLQNFYNLQEKYDRGQKGFGYEVYNKMRTFMLKEKLIDEIH